MARGVAASELRRARELYALFNARDVEGLYALMARDIEWDWSRSLGPDVGIRHGRDAVVRFLATHWEHWGEIEMLPGEIVDAGGRLVVDVTVRLRGRDGIEVKVRGGHVQVWDQGLLRQYALFQSLDEAKSKGA